MMGQIITTQVKVGASTRCLCKLNAELSLFKNDKWVPKQ